MSRNSQLEFLHSSISLPATRAGKQNYIARRCNLNSGQIKSLLRDPENYQLDDDALYALLCYIANHAEKNVVVVSPQVSIGVLHALQDPEFEVPAQDTDNIYGDIANYDIILLPVFDGTRENIDARHSYGNYIGHWLLVIHERNRETFFFDSYKNTNRLQYLHASIVKILRDLDPELSLIDPIPIKPSRAGIQHNAQDDGTSCGFYLVLYAEAFLLHNHKTLLCNFNIGIERKRLIDHLSRLFFTDHCEYIPRPLENSIFGSF